jgi:hypothetical protein
MFPILTTTELEEVRKKYDGALHDKDNVRANDRFALLALRMVPRLLATIDHQDKLLTTVTKDLYDQSEELTKAKELLQKAEEALQKIGTKHYHSTCVCDVTARGALAYFLPRP